MERRSSRTLLPILVIAVGGAVALTSCNSEETSKPETRPSVVEDTQQQEPEPEPEPEAEPEPVVPVWEDLAGTWCAGDTGNCYSITLDGESNLVNEWDGLYSFRAKAGECFSGAVGPKPGAPNGGGANVLYCPAGVQTARPPGMPESVSVAECFFGDDLNRDRVWEFHSCGGTASYRQ